MPTVKPRFDVCAPLHPPRLRPRLNAGALTWHKRHGGTFRDGMQMLPLTRLSCATPWPPNATPPLIGPSATWLKQLISRQWGANSPWPLCVCILIRKRWSWWRSKQLLKKIIIKSNIECNLSVCITSYSHLIGVEEKYRFPLFSKRKKQHIQSWLKPVACDFLIKDMSPLPNDWTQCCLPRDKSHCILLHTGVWNRGSAAKFKFEGSTFCTGSMTELIISFVCVSLCCLMEVWDKKSSAFHLHKKLSEAQFSQFSTLNFCTWGLIDWEWNSCCKISQLFFSFDRYD